MFLITVANQGVMTVTLEKLNMTYAFVETIINICGKNKLQVQLTRKKDLIAWNGFPRRITEVPLLIINIKA